MRGKTQQQQKVKQRGKTTWHTRSKYQVNFVYSLMIIKKIISYSMCWKRLTQPTNIRKKSSSCYHSMNVLTKLFKNNECFNSLLLCYLCTSYYKPYSRYCQLIIVSLIGSLWKLFNVWAINWRKIVKKVKKQLFLKTFLFSFRFWRSFFL